MITKITPVLTICIFIFITASAQNSILYDKYENGLNLLLDKKTEEAYQQNKELYCIVSSKDTLKNYITWIYLLSTSQLEEQNRMNQSFNKSLEYGLECLKIIRDNKSSLGNSFAEREPWMIKNIIVSYFGLNEFKKADEYKSELYKRFKHNSLPQGIDQFFNFDYFKIGDKNIWGYEWYEDLPKDRFSKSFTKIVYYVYSTNPDGSDKNQLYRYHVLMFHQDRKRAKFDYLLERQFETDDATISGSYYQYTYEENIDYNKLRNDIIEVITNQIEPSSRRIVPKSK